MAALSRIAALELTASTTGSVSSWFILVKPRFAVSDCTPRVMYSAIIFFPFSQFLYVSSRVNNRLHATTGSVQSRIHHEVCSVQSCTSLRISRCFHVAAHHDTTFDHTHEKLAQVTKNYGLCRWASGHVRGDQDFLSEQFLLVITNVQ